MYDSLKDKQVDDGIAELEKKERHLKILKCQVQALECNLKATREFKRFSEINLDLSRIEHEIVVVLEKIEDMENLK